MFVGNGTGSTTLFVERLKRRSIKTLQVRLAKAKVVPMVVRVLGLVSKKIKGCLEKIGIQNRMIMRTLLSLDRLTSYEKCWKSEGTTKFGRTHEN